MRGEMFEDNEVKEIEPYNLNKRTELEICQEHLKIMREYAEELEKRNMKLKQRIGTLEREVIYYEKVINGEVERFI